MKKFLFILSLFSVMLARADDEVRLTAIYPPSNLGGPADSYQVGICYHAPLFTVVTFEIATSVIGPWRVAGSWNGADATDVCIILNITAEEKSKNQLFVKARREQP